MGNNNLPFRNSFWTKGDGSFGESFAAVFKIDADFNSLQHTIRLKP